TAYYELPIMIRLAHISFGRYMHFNARKSVMKEKYDQFCSLFCPNTGAWKFYETCHSTLCLSTLQAA
ncbi:MAG: hypothetical protein AB2695_21710, partial [Candidatus Thiodiazotropha endolucinida]